LAPEVEPSISSPLFTKVEQQNCAGILVTTMFTDGLLPLLRYLTNIAIGIRIRLLFIDPPQSHAALRVLKK
jgi:hypothetical protein